MLFKKLKIYNTKEKLLQRLKEIKKEEETFKNTPFKQKLKRTFSTSQSQTTTLNSLNRLQTSPKVQCILDIEKIRMPLTFDKYQNVTRMTEIPIRQQLSTPQTPQKSILERLNEQEEEKIIRELIDNYKPEMYDVMIDNDQQEIERQNDEAHTNSMKQFQYQDYSPQRMNMIKKHQHHHHKSNPSQLKNNQRYDQEQKQLYLQQLQYKVDINSEFNTDRGKYLRKFRLANKNLNKVSQEDYRKTIKQFNKLEDYAQFYKQTPNLYIQLNQSSQQQQIFQSGLGLVQQCNHIQVANAQAQIRSPQQVKVFSDALKTQQCKTLTHLKLNHNKLNSLKIQQLTKSFPQHLQELDLMNNGLDSKSCLLLSKYIQKSQIKKVNLENNRIGDIGSNALCQAVQDHDYLLYLNLSKNNLTEHCCNELSNYIKKTQVLFELYLHFNSINSVGAVNIWKALYKNSSIKVFDISYNRTASLECSQQMAKVIIKQYPELMHIDISYNGYNEEQSIEIKKALDQNQNIYGFHYQGNCPKFSVDSTGHLRDRIQEAIEIQRKIEECKKNPQTTLKLVDDNLNPEMLIQEQQQHQKYQQKRIKDLQTDYELYRNFRFRRICGMKPIKQNYDRDSELDSCWICDGWQEVKFTWTPGKSGGMNNDPIFVHLNFENYKPVLMTLHNGEYYTYRMCPPNFRVTYFFSNPVLGIQTTAKNQLIIQTPQDDPLYSTKQSFLYNGDILIEGNKMGFVNEIFTEDKQSIMDRYFAKIFSKPREEEKTFDLTQFSTKTEKFWSYEISIFKNYQPDNDELIDECFEYDYGSSKINKIIKDPIEYNEVKEIMREYYPYIFAAYKFLASTLIGATIPCISSNAFSDFISSTQLVSEKFRSGDIDLNFIATSNVKDINYPNVYEKALVRYQLMEVLVRIAIDKYLRTQICKSIKESLRKMFEEDGIKLKLQEIDRSQDWRDMRYWNEQCDILLKDRLPMLKLLFKFTSKLNAKQKYYKHIWLQFKDFRDLLNKCDLYCDIFVERDAYLAYLLAMQTSVDELYLLKHFQMEFYEFLEALARCAEKLSLIRTNEQITIDDRRQQPLFKKLDALIYLIYIRLGEIIKAQFRESDDLSDFDKSMSKIYGQILKQPNPDEDELKIDKITPQQEEKILEEQLKTIVVQPIVNMSQPNKKSTGMTFLQVIKQAQQQKQLKNTFNLTNVVQYFRNKEEEQQLK
ncbi:unnamed protein product [Paramecium sonneborni]|uniref:Leucine Rich Repeat family protein n=1 Tax=Paramecium sonneborni TaxID=65129 RepID=A0A8S1LQE6_9CILI|nr:unnamed protein product [Paramecium sonneborni]